MDVIDEGKANRHVAVTSESLSYSKFIVTQSGYVDKDRTDIFSYVIKTTQNPQQNLTINMFLVSILIGKQVRVFYQI